MKEFFVILCVQSHLCYPWAILTCFFFQDTQLSRTVELCKDHKWQSLTITIWNLCLLVNNSTVTIQRAKNSSEWQLATVSKRILSATAAVGYTGWSFAVPSSCSTVGTVRQEQLAGSECGVHMYGCHPVCAWVPLEAAIYVLWQRFPYGGAPIIAKAAFLAWGGFPTSSRYLCFQDMSHGKLLTKMRSVETTRNFQCCCLVNSAGEWVQCCLLLQNFP